MLLSQLNLSNSVTFQAVPEMRVIARLLEPMKISYFTYDEVFKNGSTARLTTHGDWIQTYYEAGLYQVAAFENEPKNYKSGVVFWGDLSTEVYIAAEQFDIAHGLTIIRKKKSSCAFYHFGCRKKEKISRESMEKKLAGLNNFIMYFHDVGARLVCQARNESILLPCNKILSGLDAIALLARGCFNAKGLVVNNENQHMTPAEAKVAMDLLNGMKYKEISEKQDISTKMVGLHLRSIKEKIGCSNHVQLGRKLSDIKLIWEQNSGNLVRLG